MGFASEQRVVAARMARVTTGAWMPTRTAQPCAERGDVEALIRGVLSAGQLDAVELHLAECTSCRSYFRQQTAARYPKIRNYTITGEVGRGGFGVVYRAVHHAKQRVEAIKVLFGKTAQRVAYFENEVRLVANLNHPHIATLYDAQLRGSPPYYAMEYVKGRQLDAYFQSGEVSLEERIELFKQVALAVGYAHAEGVIHRDLKPQNILIDEEGAPHIVDFGIAKRFDMDAGVAEAERRAEGAIGTYGYISPEQLAGRDVDARADIFTLGALLFHMITGQPARFAPHVDRLTEVLRERRVSRADDLAAIIACCVREAREERYPTCEALVADLDNYLGGKAIVARRDAPPGEQVARISGLVLRNYPLPVQTLVAVVLAALLTWSFWTTGANFMMAGTRSARTVLVGVDEATFEAVRSGALEEVVPGLGAVDVDDPQGRLDLRLLYGKLMERIGAARPNVVVWDYYFRRCHPDPAVDAALVRGMRAVGAPVVVGSLLFDLNAEPMICARVRAAVHGCGSIMATRPGAHDETIYPLLVIERGYNRPIPSLALAGFAAARRPDCEFEVRVKGQEIHVAYRKREVKPGEPKWLDPASTDVVPVFRTERASDRAMGLNPGDVCRFGRHELEQMPGTIAEPVSAMDVLTADAAQLRGWFDGAAVLVGQTLPGVDLHRWNGDEALYGCQAQAMLLTGLLEREHVKRMGRADLLLRVCAWGLLAAFVVNLIPSRMLLPVESAWWAALVMVLLSLAVVLAVSYHAHDRLVVELGIGGSALLASGAGALVVRALHERQLRLTPAPMWATDGTTASTTLLATTRNPSSRS